MTNSHPGLTPIGASLLLLIPHDAANTRNNHGKERFQGGYTSIRPVTCLCKSREEEI